MINIIPELHALNEEFKFQPRNIEKRQDDRKEREELKFQQLVSESKELLHDFMEINDRFISYPFKIKFDRWKNDVNRQFQDQVEINNNFMGIFERATIVGIPSTRKSKGIAFYSSSLFPNSRSNDSNCTIFFNKILGIKNQSISYSTGLIIEFFEANNRIFRDASDLYHFSQQMVAFKNKKDYEEILQVLKDNGVKIYSS